MDKKYGETPQQKVERAFKRAINQPSQHDDVFGMSNEQAMNVVITRLVHELEKDKGPNSLYYAWQSNIAMSFVDAYKKWHVDNGYIFTNANFEFTLIEIANTAAKNFLDNLCTQPKISENKKPNE